MTMPTAMRADVAADYEKLKGFVLKPGRAGINVRHSQAGAVGAMGFIILFAVEQEENVSELAKGHEVLKEEVDKIFDLEWVAAGGGVSRAEERRNCDMYIGYNLQHDEYVKRYPDVKDWPDKLDMTCQAAPGAEKAITAMFEKLVAVKDKAKTKKAPPRSAAGKGKKGK